MKRIFTAVPSSDVNNVNKTNTHITPAIMRSAMDIMKKTNDLRMYLVCLLLYWYGFRIGEILGLTRQDLVSVVKNGEPCYYVNLRNRFSDNADQICKGLGQPVLSTFNTNHVRTLSTIRIDERLYELLLVYYRKSRDTDTIYASATNRQAAEKVIRQIKIETLADSDNMDTNHYIFIHDNGNRFSCQTFTLYLRRYLAAAGLPNNNKATASLLRKNSFAYMCYNMGYLEDHYNKDVRLSYLRESMHFPFDWEEWPDWEVNDDSDLLQAERRSHSDNIKDTEHRR